MDHPSSDRPMNILISGSSGLIGSAFGSYLLGNRHRVMRLVRRAPQGANEIRWDPASGTLDIRALEGLDAVVHLAGESIASGRWTSERKRRIRDSRIQGTRLLARSLSSLSDPPKVFVSVSAIGYYGDRGEEQLVEESEAGRGFLPELCRDWEAATHPAVNRGIRVVIPRLGMVLSAQRRSAEPDAPHFSLRNRRQDWQRPAVHELDCDRRSCRCDRPRNFQRVPPWPRQCRFAECRNQSGVFSGIGTRILAPCPFLPCPLQHCAFFSGKWPMRFCFRAPGSFRRGWRNRALNSSSPNWNPRCATYFSGQ